MSELDDLLASVASEIRPYRKGDFPEPTREHVERWLHQVLALGLHEITLIPPKSTCIRKKIPCTCKKTSCIRLRTNGRRSMSRLTDSSRRCRPRKPTSARRCSRGRRNRVIFCLAPIIRSSGRPVSKKRHLGNCKISYQESLKVPKFLQQVSPKLPSRRCLTPIVTSPKRSNDSPASASSLSEPKDSVEK